MDASATASASILPGSFMPAADEVRYQAHDLKNKLQIVVGFCDLLISGTLADPRQAVRMIGNIRAAAADSARIAGAIMAQGRPALDTVDLNELLLAEARLLCQDLLGQDINVHVERTVGLPEVRVNRLWLARTIVNLAHNARDAIVGQPRRTQAGVIRFATSRPAIATARPCVLLTVADNGPGMDEAALARIWDPGWSTKRLAPGDASPRGYGLASVRSFAAECGGMVDVCSAPGQGTEFVLCLPAI